MPFATRGRHRLYYELTGTPAAPPLLLLRGFARSSRYWFELLPLLAPHFSLLLLDNRGVGRSSAPWPPYSTAAMAEDTRIVLDHAGLSRVHLFGISLGGMIALELASRHPDRIDRLVLGATTTGGRDAVGIPRSAILGLLGTAHLPFDEAMRRTAPIAASDEFVRQKPHVLDEWVRLARLEPPSRLGLIGQLLAAATHDVSATVASINLPTLILTGDADRLIPHENSRRLARSIRGATLSILPGGGHDFPAEKPEETARLLIEFLTTRPA